MAIALGIALPLGLTAGVLAVLIEIGLLIDPRRNPAPGPNDHLKVFGLVAGGALPSGMVSLFQESIWAVIIYSSVSSGTFLTGMLILAIYWIKSE